MLINKYKAEYQELFWKSVSTSIARSEYCQLQNLIESAEMEMEKQCLRPQNKHGWIKEYIYKYLHNLTTLIPFGGG